MKIKKRFLEKWESTVDSDYCFALAVILYSVLLSHIYFIKGQNHASAV